MAYSCCPGNFSSCSLRHSLTSSGSPCGSSYPSKLVYTTTSCSPSPCRVESSVNTRCQETCIEPTSCQRSCMVFRPCQTACYSLRSSTPCSPCRGSYAGSLGFGCSSCQSLGCGSRSCYSGGCGCSGFRAMNYRFCDFPSLSDGSRICYPTYLAVPVTLCC